MMNNLLFVNLIKLVFFVKIDTNLLLKPIDCLSITISRRMCSITNTERGLNTSSPLSERLSLPQAVKGIDRLDISAFDKRVRLPAMYIDTSSSIKDALKILRTYKLKLMKFQPVVDDEANDEQGVTARKLIILDPRLIVDFSSFDESVRIQLKEQNITENNFHYVERTITFENWSLEEIIKAVLPDDLKFSGYSVIGHIAHLNLRPELLDFKHVLGEIILNKIKHVRTVVNKINTIENIFRNFQMELICGENDMKTKLRENACTYELDFSKVYWNPRLSTEHRRIFDLLDKNDVLYDVFAGIGPFVIPAAKKGCLVVANDLNPDAYKWLLHNIKLNKVGRNIECFNIDAKDFILIHIKKHLLNIVDYKGTDRFKVHITMNLPASAVGYMNDFLGLVTEDEFKSVPKDIVCHLYCFIKVENLDKLDDKYLSGLAKEFVETHLHRRLTDNLIEICYVRKVSPTKAMFRVSFLFEPDFLIRKSTKRNNEGDDDAVINKK